ncbi:MAG: ATP-binding protein, partial [Polyangiaceae bacterium]
VALKRAESAIAARDETVAALSHDLRDPLGIIQGNALFIQRVLATPGADLNLLQKRLDAIRRAGKRMERLIADLLDIAKLEDGKLRVDMTEVEVGPLLQQAFEEALPMADHESVNLELVQCAELVRCDRERILQVFSNLVGNALKLTPREGTVTLGAERVDGVCRFFVRDTGPGIATDNLDRVFTRFWQVGAHDRLGAGLGLAIARGIIDAHGGRIWVESKHGHGATFYFTLAA